MPPRILIIGQGLAGTALAWRLWERGVPFVIVDRDEALTCSKVAAGLITPITGMRLTVSWRYTLFYREALGFYRRCIQRLGQRFFFPRGYVRLLKNEAEIAKWHKRRRDPDMQPFLHPQPPLLNAEVIHDPANGFQQRHAAWLDTITYLKASRSFFTSLGAWMQAEVPPTDVRDDATGVEWQGQRFSHVIWAQGWSAEQHPLFKWVPFQSARGTILTVQADLQGEQRILNRACWLLPGPMAPCASAPPTNGSLTTRRRPPPSHSSSSKPTCAAFSKCPPPSPPRRPPCGPSSKTSKPSWARTPHTPVSPSTTASAPKAPSAAPGSPATSSSICSMAQR